MKKFKDKGNAISINCLKNLFSKGISKNINFRWQLLNTNTIKCKKKFKKLNTTSAKQLFFFWKML